MTAVPAQPPAVPDELERRHWPLPATREEMKHLLDRARYLHGFAAVITMAPATYAELRRMNERWEDEDAARTAGRSRLASVLNPLTANIAAFIGTPIVVQDDHEDGVTIRHRRELR